MSAGRVTEHVVEGVVKTDVYARHERRRLDAVFSAVVADRDDEYNAIDAGSLGLVFIDNFLRELNGKLVRVVILIEDKS